MKATEVFTSKIKGVHVWPSHLCASGRRPGGHFISNSRHLAAWSFSSFLPTLLYNAALFQIKYYKKWNIYVRGFHRMKHRKWVKEKEETRFLIVSHSSTQLCYGSVSPFFISPISWKNPLFPHEIKWFKQKSDYSQ